MKLHKSLSKKKEELNAMLTFCSTQAEQIYYNIYLWY